MFISIVSYELCMFIVVIIGVAEFVLGELDVFDWVW